MSEPQNHRHVLSGPICLLAVPVLAGVMLLNVGASIAGAAPSSMALNIAKYAVATAAHDRPAHAVTSEDIKNAVATTKVNTSHLGLSANLGDLLEYPRIATFVDSSTFATICVDFPGFVGASPTVVSCTPQEKALPVMTVTVLNMSRDAIAIAALRGAAVSGADVARAAALQNWPFANKPNFRSGQGAVVRFTNKATSITNVSAVTVAITICVRFPKTAYGVPLQVRC